MINHPMPNKGTAPKPPSALPSLVSFIGWFLSDHWPRCRRLGELGRYMTWRSPRTVVLHRCDILNLPHSVRSARRISRRVAECRDSARRSIARARLGGSRAGVLLAMCSLSSYNICVQPTPVGALGLIVSVSSGVADEGVSLHAPTLSHLPILVKFYLSWPGNLQSSHRKIVHQYNLQDDVLPMLLVFVHYGSKQTHGTHTRCLLFP